MLKASLVFRSLVLGAALVACALLLGRERSPAHAAVATQATRFCGEQRLFGYIRSLNRSGTNYRLRFDPAFFLSGRTANQAAAQDAVVPKGQPVPNDNYVVNESHRTYLYIVTQATQIRVLLKGGDSIKGSPISIERLAQFVRGRHADKLFESFQSGFWLGVHIDHACSLTQQYRP